MWFEKEIIYSDLIFLFIFLLLIKGLGNVNKLANKCGTVNYFFLSACCLLKAQLGYAIYGTNVCFGSSLPSLFLRCLIKLNERGCGVSVVSAGHTASWVLICSTSSCCSLSES